jgi:hypothetical protein
VAPQEERRRVSAVDLIYDYVLELFYGVMCEYCMENGDDVHVVGRCADCRQEEKPTRMKRFRMTRKIPKTSKSRFDSTRQKNRDPDFDPLGEEEEIENKNFLFMFRCSLRDVSRRPDVPRGPRPLCLQVVA